MHEANQNTATSKYLDTLLLYFEEEIMGEAYFCGFMDYFEQPHAREKMDLMAQVERHTAEAVRPLLHKYGLTSRAESKLKLIGEGWLKEREGIDWDGLMEDMAFRYPEYLAQFKALEAIAPEEDLCILNILTEHEVAAIEFARMEIADNPDSTAPLRKYLKLT